MKEKCLLLILLSVLPLVCAAQVDTGVKVTESQQQGALLDSVKQTPYPYIFPLLGKRAAAKGFVLPYPAGVMLNFYTGNQRVTVSDLTVGINSADGSEVVPPTSLDEVVTFGKVKATINNINVRADLWLFPFMNIYGVFGMAWVRTDVNIAAIMNQPVDISTSAHFRGPVYGFGSMLSGGIRSVFFSGDFNMMWTHFKEMSNDNRVVNLSFRTGYVFHLRRPERNVALWAGTGCLLINGNTSGSLLLSDVAPDMGTHYTSQTWYQNLPPDMQRLTDRVVANYVDKHKGDIINYSLTKRPLHNWTMIIGAQFQIDRHWQLRTEVNLLGGRHSGLISANYRFGL